SLPFPGEWVGHRTWPQPCSPHLRREVRICPLVSQIPGEAALSTSLIFASAMCLWRGPRPDLLPASEEREQKRRAKCDCPQLVEEGDAASELPFELRDYPKSALLMASGVVGFSHRLTPTKRAGTALAS